MLPSHQFLRRTLAMRYERSISWHDVAGTDRLHCVLTQMFTGGRAVFKGAVALPLSIEEEFYVSDENAEEEENPIVPPSSC